ncbi:hypothetical protein RCL1_000279 [Eukaryota sp. TZLM3-RCL]
MPTEYSADYLEMISRIFAMQEQGASVQPVVETPSIEEMESVYPTNDIYEDTSSPSILEPQSTVTLPVLRTSVPSTIVDDDLGGWGLKSTIASGKTPIVEPLRPTTTSMRHRHASITRERVVAPIPSYIEPSEEVKQSAIAEQILIEIEEDIEKIKNNKLRSFKSIITMVEFISAVRRSDYCSSDDIMMISLFQDVLLTIADSVLSLELSSPVAAFDATFPIQQLCSTLAQLFKLVRPNMSTVTKLFTTLLPIFNIDRTKYYTLLAPKRCCLPVMSVIISCLLDHGFHSLTGFHIDTNSIVYLTTFAVVFAEIELYQHELTPKLLDEIGLVCVPIANKKLSSLVSSVVLEILLVSTDFKGDGYGGIHGSSAVLFLQEHLVNEEDISQFTNVFIAMIIQVGKAATRTDSLTRLPGRFLVAQLMFYYGRFTYTKLKNILAPLTVLSNSSGCVEKKIRHSTLIVIEFLSSLVESLEDHDSLLGCTFLMRLMCDVASTESTSSIRTIALKCLVDLLKLFDQRNREWDADLPEVANFVRFAKNNLVMIAEGDPVKGVRALALEAVHLLLGDSPEMVTLITTRLCDVDAVVRCQALECLDSIVHRLDCSSVFDFLIQSYLEVLQLFLATSAKLKYKTLKRVIRQHLDSYFALSSHSSFLHALEKLKLGENISCLDEYLSEIVEENGV